MGQKVNPNGFRFGITKKHNASWFANKKDYPIFLKQDLKIRKFIKKYDREYAIGQIEIQRFQNTNITINIHSAKPGVILGQSGAKLKEFSQKLSRYLKDRNLVFNINVIAIENPNLNANLVAQSIAISLENRGSFRAAQKTAIRNTLKAGAMGIKTQVAGRLNGADMARTEGYTKGIMSLHTLRQDVEFATAIARTTYGAIGVKVWISKGLILNKRQKEEQKEGDQ